MLLVAVDADDRALPIWAGDAPVARPAFPIRRRHRARDTDPDLASTATARCAASVPLDPRQERQNVRCSQFVRNGPLTGSSPTAWTFSVTPASQIGGTG